jgi:hypothetical protein
MAKKRYSKQRRAIARKKKNSLLKESQVRRFMGLAGLGSLSESQGLYEEEEEMDAEVPADDEVPVDDEMGDEMEMDAEEPEEAEGTVELEQDDVDTLAELAEKLPDIVAKLQGGAPAGDEMAGDEMAGDEMAGDEMDMDMDMGAEEEMGDEEEEADEEEVVMEALRGVNLQLSEKEVVNEVARRVAKRILKAKQAQQKLDEALGNKKPVRRSSRKPFRRSRKK